MALPASPLPNEPAHDEPSVASSAAAPRVAPSASGPTVKQEMDQMAEIRKAAPSDPARALALAEEGHARFPRSVFWQEREMAAIGALARLGRSGEARERARAFLQRHPESPYAEGLRKLAEGE
jgi:hypothetical protein